MLLRYGSGFARLSTNNGVVLTTNLSTIDAALLKAQYDKVTDLAARANMKAQAQRSGVNVSTWTTP